MFTASLMQQATSSASVSSPKAYHCWTSVLTTMSTLPSAIMPSISYLWRGRLCLNTWTSTQCQRKWQAWIRPRITAIGPQFS